MTRRMYLWLVPLLFYAVFTFWYTNLGGPLTDVEIDEFVLAMEQNGADSASINKVRQFMETDTGRQFLMVNNIDMADDPGDVKGAEPGESADQIMNRYMEHMYPELFKRASHPIYIGEAVFDALDIVGIEGAESWTRTALFRYRSRRDLMEIASNPAFQGKHHFKQAALDKTIAYPLENTLYLSDPRFLLALVLLAVVALSDIAFFRRNRS